MKYLKQILTLLWKAWIMLLASILTLLIGVFWTFPLALSDRTFPLAYKGIRLWSILIFYGSGFRLEVENKKELDKNQAYIISSNHHSYFDILVLSILHKNHPIVFVGKAELSKIPIFGMIYKRICIIVDRSNIRSRVNVYQSAKEKINLGYSIVIFPEGGIPDDKDLVLNRFKDGAFSIAISTQVPIALYAIKGLKEMLPEAWSQGYPGKVKVKLIDVIHTENLSLKNKSELKNSCYEKLQHELISH